MALNAEVLTSYKKIDEAYIDELLKKEIEKNNKKIVVLDDDPTGVQTVHDISVYTNWEKDTIRQGFDEENNLFYVLTNSRGFTAEQTTKAHNEIAAVVDEVAKETGKEYIFISRSDSTLRGHYPLETKLLKKNYEANTGKTIDGEILCPFFKEGGRYTIDNVHYVKYGEELIPANETEFAKDKTFGYSAATMPEYVEEKTKGAYKASDVTCISLEDIHDMNIDKIEEALMEVKDFNKIIVNAVDYADVKVFCVALYRAMAKGKVFMFRTAAAIVKVMGGVTDQPLLSREQMVVKETDNGGIKTMGMKINAELPLPANLKAEYPLPKELAEIKKKRDAEIREIFEGKSDKFVVIVGPCSADNEDSVCDYVNRLAKVNEKVSDRLMIIPRIYTNKPRTTGEGYKGMLHQPDPDQAPNLLEGIIAIRRMHIRAIKETGLTSADEMLYPENRSYLDDILSYEAIGARSVENQQHRLTASGMDIPVGMKNPTSGDFSVMMNSVIAAQNSHNFIYRGMDVTTEGNDLAHVILRGGVDKYGTCIPNYHYEDLVRLVDVYAKKDLKNPAAIIDANHSNSNKQFKEQIRIVSEILHSRRYNDDVKKMVKGVMIESYIEEGNQKICDHMTYGKSITDPCLGWEDTEKLIYKIAEEC